jgi:hypothetical protein
MQEKSYQHFLTEGTSFSEVGLSQFTAQEGSIPRCLFPSGFVTEGL